MSPIRSSCRMSRPGRVKTVTIAGDRITGTYTDNSTGFQTYSPGDPSLVSRLRGQERHHQRASRNRRLQLALRLSDLVAADDPDPRRLDLLHAPDAVRLRPRHGLRQVQGQASDRSTWPRHLRGRRRRRRGQGRSGGDRRLPARPAEVPAPGRQDPARRAAGRPSRHRQDAAGPRGRRRGQRAVLHHLRFGLRRDVRRRRRQPRARHVRAGQEERALHHLHRRNRRRRPPSRRRPRRRQRRARADAEPAAGRDGRLRGQRRHHPDRRHQPSRRARPGAAASGPLRPPGRGAEPRHRRPREDPEGAHAQRAAGPQRRPQGHRARHAGLLRRRPGEPGQRRPP